MAVRTDLRDRVLHVTLDRAEARNALDVPTLHALRDAIAAARDDPAVRAVLLRSEGPVFCAGGDIRTMAESAGRPQAVLERLRDGLAQVVLGIHDLPKPVACRVHGDAFGAGAVLAFQCDLTLASATARFQLSFRNVGLVPDTGATWLLPRRLGMQRAKHLAWGAQAFTADEAAAWGLVLEAVPPAQLDARCAALAAELAAAPAATLALQKRAFHEHAGVGLADALLGEARLQAQASTTAEHAEGREAFLQKRKPSWP